jgi:hypothetical protein
MENDNSEGFYNQTIYNIVYDQTINLLQMSWEDYSENLSRKLLMARFRERMGGNEIIHGINKK